MPERLPRWLGLLFLALFVLSALVTLLILSTSGRRGRVVGAAPAPGALSSAPAIDLAPTFRDFWFPEEGDRRAGDPDPDRPGPGFHPFRERMGVWSEEMVDRFWVPPREIAVEILTRKNDEHIRELFEDIP